LATIEAYRTFTVPMFTIPLSGVVIGVGPHVRLERDADRALHSTDGPAWLWPDGTAVWALRGIRVPSWVVTDPDPGRILTELDNTEQRRVGLEHYGWDRAVADLGLAPVDVSEDPHLGTLYDLPEQLVEEEASARLLVARNASPDRDGSWRTYGLLVDAGCSTVRGAQAWLAQLSEDEWAALDGAS
jgi:hypothetical protein